MAGQIKTSRTLLIFYSLVFYILLQFSWWSYLLINLNKEIYQQRIEFAKSTINDDALLEKRQTEFNALLKKRWAMVAGEGAVFLSLLIFGIYRTKRAFNQEFELAQQQKNFLLSITHEFKSPLAAIKLSLQTIEKRTLEENQKKEIITRALNETDRINLLIENALFASRLELQNSDYHFEEFNLSSFIAELVENYRTRIFSDSNIELLIENNIHFKGDKLAITSLVYNLLENAEKYSTNPAQIVVELKRLSNNIELNFSDYGFGIEMNERNKVFEKFYRVGNEETRKTKGTGLGLYIVKKVVNMHRGTIDIKSNNPIGTIFSIKLPI
ncbi:MAG: sensor histidine kinase [Bacteroidota bacterium]|jgi:two-component system phosphate regulon sensor histidine kinase PhoR